MNPTPETPDGRSSWLVASTGIGVIVGAILMLRQNSRADMQTFFVLALIGGVIVTVLGCTKRW